MQADAGSCGTARPQFGLAPPRGQAPVWSSSRPCMFPLLWDHCILPALDFRQNFPYDGLQVGHRRSSSLENVARVPRGSGRGGGSQGAWIGHRASPVACLLGPAWRLCPCLVPDAATVGKGEKARWERGRQRDHEGVALCHHYTQRFVQYLL
ncbi:hypothetical protein NDU88_000026 [Pleurodeles waltl]|uniref:Uncharacterized protein n=1 Tax=Pleurodeles waltl TaxID=8319 RepID=A0AAV7URX0_PLEWA|nr:hypothetical protein NDU88_000026 [Pleurodeles waltl]